MSHIVRAIPILALCAVAAGCARPAPPPPPAPAPAVPTPSAADGTYRGTSTRFQADSRSCPSPGLVTLRVLDGVFSYRWRRDVAIIATVSRDGSVQGSVGDIVLNGHVVADRIEGDVSNGVCGFHFTAKKRV